MNATVPGPNSRISGFLPITRPAATTTQREPQRKPPCPHHAIAARATLRYACVPSALNRVTPADGRSMTKPSSQLRCFFRFMAVNKTVKHRTPLRPAPVPPLASLQLADGTLEALVRCLGGACDTRGVTGVRVGTLNFDAGRPEPRTEGQADRRMVAAPYCGTLDSSGSTAVPRGAVAVTRTRLDVLRRRGERRNRAKSKSRAKSRKSIFKPFPGRRSADRRLAACFCAPVALVHLYYG